MEAEVGAGVAPPNTIFCLFCRATIAFPGLPANRFLHFFLLEVYIDNVFVMSSRETYSSYFSFSLLQSFSLTHINTKLIYHQLSLNNYVPLKFSDVHFLPLHMTTRDRIRKYERKFNIIPRMNENWCIGNLREYYMVPVSF